MTKGCGVKAFYDVFTKNFTFPFTPFDTFLVVLLFLLEFVDLYLCFLLKKRLLLEADDSQLRMEPVTEYVDNALSGTTYR